MNPNHPNVIALIFDTLRSDYLSCYGGTSNTSTFEALAKQGLLFESAFATGPGTPITHASLYTGQHPTNHGVTGQYLDLPDNIPVMAEQFQKSGYDTFGITGPSKMGSTWNYDRGFDTLVEPYLEFPEPVTFASFRKVISDSHYRKYLLRQVTRGGTEKTRYKFDLLKDRLENDLERPCFTLVNFLTTHAPYDPPRPYKEQADQRFSRSAFPLVEYLLERPGVIQDPSIRLERVMNMQTADGVGRFLADSDYINKKEIELLRSWYGATVKFLDEEFGRFMNYYRENRQDDTILIVTADHGEQLGEHGLWEHSHYFFDETLQIPLIMAGPGIPVDTRREDLISQIDIFPTLCELCNIEKPTKMDGESVFSGEIRDAVFMEYGKRNIHDFANGSGHGRYLDDDSLREFVAGRKAVRTYSHRYEIDSRGEERLLKIPSQEQIDEASKETCDTLRNRIETELSAEFGVWPEGDPDEQTLGPAVKENLRDLGYID